MPQTAPEQHTPGSALRMEEVQADAPAATLADARTLLLEYGRFVLSQPGVARFCFGTLEKEAERLPLSYQERGGGFLISHIETRIGDHLAGCVAWHTLAPNAVIPVPAWEIKRLWVRPEARGHNLDRAPAAGIGAVYLDTVPAAMPAAYKLYLDMGFSPCPPYNDNPVADLAYLVKYL